MIDSIHDVLARVHERAGANIDIVAIEDALRMSAEIAKLRSELGAHMVRAEQDTGAVVALMDAAGELPIPQFESMPKLAAATNALYAQFEDRIDEADKREREGRVRTVQTEGDAADEALKQARWQYGRKARESFRTFVDGDGEEI